jgi:acetyltransferase-like isoleucine patch superfamily enzyme
MPRREYLRRAARFGFARLLNRTRARWYFRHAESVGRNLVVRGRPLISNRNVVIGDNVTIISTHRRTHFLGEGRIELGSNSIINSGALLISAERITLEEYAGISIEAIVSDSNLHPIGSDPIRTAPVVLGRGSWLGIRAIVMPGVRIGSRALVAAGSIVTKDVEDDTLVAGIPARFVRKLEYPPGQRMAYRHESAPAEAGVWARAVREPGADVGDLEGTAR